MDAIVKCKKCEQILNESSDLNKTAEEEPCPNCGSLSRLVEITLNDQIEIHDIIAGKAKHGGKGKPYVKFKAGDDLFRKDNKWVNLKRTIDRENDWYEELITDPETGEIIHKCSEPLSQHQIHGTAKSKEALLKQDGIEKSESETSRIEGLHSGAIQASNDFDEALELKISKTVNTKDFTQNG